MELKNNSDSHETVNVGRLGLGLERGEGKGLGEVITPDENSAQTDIASGEHLYEDLVRARRSAEEASRTKSRFLAIMSHEVRTPLNGVLGALQLLSETNPKPQQVDLINLARSSAESLRRVANDIVDLSRLEAGRLDLELAPFDISRLFSEVCAFWRPMAEAKNLSLNLIVGKTLPDRVVGDSARIRQIINNYLSNAINFTDEGGIEVEIATNQHKKTASLDVASVHIEVRDTGIGIAREEQKKLFMDYSQMKNKTHCQRSGAGLGLAICRELANCMGGSVGVKSTPLSGSTFWFRLPLKVGQAKSSTSSTAPSPNELPLLLNEAGASPRVLLVEDSVTNQIIAQAYLEGFGCLVDVAEDGLEAIGAVRNTNYDTILMDVSMPRMDGEEATRQIRTLAEPTARTPILGQTAFASEEETMTFLAAGMNDVVTKPLDRDVLHHALSRMLASTSATGEHSEIPDNLSIYLDTPALGKLRDSLSREQFEKLLDRVILDIDTTGKNAISGAMKGDIKTLAMACHTLKGLGASFGNPKLEAIGHCIQNACRNDDAARATAMALSGLETVCERSLVALKAYRQLM